MQAQTLLTQTCPMAAGGNCSLWERCIIALDKHRIRNLHICIKCLLGSATQVLVYLLHHVAGSDGSLWESCIIAPDELEICKRPTGAQWKLGSGAFGTVRFAAGQG